MKWDENSIAVCELRVRLQQVLPDFNECKGSFYRVAVPQDIVNGTPNPSSWGAPSAVLEASHCNLGQYFANHSIVFGKSTRHVWVYCVLIRNLFGQT